ncbi:hypothetical protein FRC03_005306 [Tulasnella sp. 419]|nr:hypothetical protein FRC03_005306 [Tulasnella sp. 419]
MISSGPNIESSVNHLSDPDIKQHEEVTASLLNIGAVELASLDGVLRNPFDMLSVQTQEEKYSSVKKMASSVVTDYIHSLDSECKKLFGKDTSILSYEHSLARLASGVHCWGSSLTIKSPSGFSKKFSVAAIFSTKRNAQQAVSKKALNDGVVSLLSSSSSSLATDFLDEAEYRSPTDPGSLGQPALPIRDHATEQDQSAEISTCNEMNVIESLCSRLFDSSVKPFWLFSIEKTGTSEVYGCLLEMRLSPRIARVWSTDNKFHTAEEAQNAVTKAALRDDIEGFLLRHQNSRQSFPPNLAVSHGTQPPINGKTKEPVVQVSLQSFLKDLPGTLPSDVGLDESQVNPIEWMNTKPQQSRGKLEVKYEPFTDLTMKNFGCLLRLEATGTGESKSYFVDALFARKQEAKAAVCALAMSDGCAGFISRLVTVNGAGSSPKKGRNSKSEFIEGNRVPPGFGGYHSYASRKHNTQSCSGKHESPRRKNPVNYNMFLYHYPVADVYYWTKALIWQS